MATAAVAQQRAGYGQQRNIIRSSAPPFARAQKNGRANQFTLGPLLFTSPTALLRSSPLISLLTCTVPPCSPCHCHYYCCSIRVRGCRCCCQRNAQRVSVIKRGGGSQSTATRWDHSVRAIHNRDRHLHLQIFTHT